MAVVQLANRLLKTDESGHASYQTLEELKEVFSEAEIVAMVNKWIDNAKSQREAHKKYFKKGAKLIKPLQTEAKAMFGKDFDLLEDKQRKAVVEKVLKVKASAGVLRPPLAASTPGTK